MSAIGAAGAGFADKAGTVIDQFTQSLFNAQAAAKSWDKQKDWATRSPTYARIGLEAAGFNPILALGSGGISTSAKAPQAQGVSGGRATVSESMLRYKQAQLAETQKALTVQSAKESHAREMEADARRALAEAELPKASALAEEWSTNGKEHARDTVIASTTANNWAGQLMREVRSIFESYFSNPRGGDVSDLVDAIQASSVPVEVKQKLLDKLDEERRKEGTSPVTMRKRLEAFMERVLNAYLSR